MGSTGQSVFGALFDPANESGLVGKNKGPGAFLAPNKAQGGMLWPGGPGLPGGQTSGEIGNAAAAAIAGGVMSGGFGGAMGDTATGESTLTGGGGMSGAISNANPFSPGFGTASALANDPGTAGISPDMVISGGSSMPGTATGTASNLSTGMNDISPMLKMAQQGQQTTADQPNQQPKPQAPVVPRIAGNSLPYTPPGGTMVNNPGPLASLQAYHNFLSSVG
jgi:hypothetical protein